MGLFTPNHGNYEVSYKARTMPFIDKNKEPSKTIIVEANDLGDARRQAEKQLKSAGYKFIIIERAQLIKRTSGSRSDYHGSRTYTQQDSCETYSKNDNETHQSAYRSASHYAPHTTVRAATASTNGLKFKPLYLWLILIPLAAMVVITVIFTFNYMGRENVEGTYYLKSISGNIECSANSNENYCVLEDGVCTLYFTLTDPAGSSVHTFTYDGKTFNSIEFDKDIIKMNWNDCIEIKFDYGNGQYNIFTYEKGR